MPPPAICSRLTAGVSRGATTTLTLTLTSPRTGRTPPAAIGRWVATWPGVATSRRDTITDGVIRALVLAAERVVTDLIADIVANVSGRFVIANCCLAPQIADRLISVSRCLTTCGQLSAIPAAA